MAPSLQHLCCDGTNSRGFAILKPSAGRPWLSGGAIWVSGALSVPLLHIPRYVFVFLMMFGHKYIPSVCFVCQSFKPIVACQSKSLSSHKHPFSYSQIIPILCFVCSLFVILRNQMTGNKTWGQTGFLNRHKPCVFWSCQLSIIPAMWHWITSSAWKVTGSFFPSASHISSLTCFPSERVCNCTLPRIWGVGITRTV